MEQEQQWLERAKAAAKAKINAHRDQIKKTVK
jgi:hypothetical protein